AVKALDAKSKAAAEKIQNDFEQRGKKSRGTLVATATNRPNVYRVPDYAQRIDNNATILAPAPIQASAGVNNNPEVLAQAPISRYVNRRTALSAPTSTATASALA